MSLIAITCRKERSGNLNKQGGIWKSDECRTTSEHNNIGKRERIDEAYVTNKYHEFNPR
jgi:hypothetical protein